MDMAFQPMGVHIATMDTHIVTMDVAFQPLDRHIGPMDAAL
jgi:hypothetical protein